MFTVARTPASLVLAAGTLTAILFAAQSDAQNSAGVNPPQPSAPQTGTQGTGPAGNKPGVGTARPSPTNVDQSKVKVSEHMTVDIHVQGEEITNVLEMLAVQSQKNIVPSKNVSGKIPSLNLYNVTFYEALDAILHVNGYGYIEQNNFIYVYTTDELLKLQQQLQKRSAKTIRLNYLNAIDAAEFCKPLLSGQGAEMKTVAKVENFAIGDAPSGKDDIALSATLVIFDYEENIAAIEALLKELDTRPAQVQIQATVLATRLTENNAFGVDFSLISSVNFTDFATSALKGPLGVLPNLIGGAVAPSDNRAQAATSSVGNVAAGPGGFKFGIISDPLAVFVRMLDQVGTTTTLANPKLLTLNRQPSSIVVGQRIPYISTTTADTTTTQTVQFLDTGVSLFFRPFVTNNGQIRMEIKPQLSDAEIIKVQGPATAPVDAPRENKQQVTTNILVPDGMTVVIGGLFREVATNSRNQVPGLGDLPVIGAAFRGHDDSLIREEVMFAITPTIINDNVLLSQGEDSKDAMDRIRAGTRQSMLPWSRDKRTQQLNREAAEAMRAGDFATANMKISHSLSLNPQQADAMALREKINGERELWPSKQVMMHNTPTSSPVDKLDRSAPAPATPEPWRRPTWQVDVPKVPNGTKVGANTNTTTNNEPAPAPTTQATSEPAQPATTTTAPSNTAANTTTEPMAPVPATTNPEPQASEPQPAPAPAPAPVSESTSSVSAPSNPAEVMHARVTTEANATLAAAQASGELPPDAVASNEPVAQPVAIAPSNLENMIPVPAASPEIGTQIPLMVETPVATAQPAPEQTPSTATVFPVQVEHSAPAVTPAAKVAAAVAASQTAPVQSQGWRVSTNFASPAPTKDTAWIPAMVSEPAQTASITAPELYWTPPANKGFFGGAWKQYQQVSRNAIGQPENFATVPTDDKR